MTNPLIPDYSQPKHAHTRKRHRAEMRFKWYGRTAIIVAALFLSSLLHTIIGNGSSAFISTQIQLDITITEGTSERKLIKNALKSAFPKVTGRSDKRLLSGMISNGSAKQLRLEIQQNPDLINSTTSLWFIASSQVDQQIKHDKSRLKSRQKSWLNSLQQQGRTRTVFNLPFFQNADSREPEIAGIWGATLGSWYVILTCMLLAFPIGIMTATYLQEFAPKNRWTDFIELNINNLAAVPSIVYGLLALEIFLNFMTLPRSAPLVGGLTLAMLVLPIMVITCRNALAAVPPSIREAARGLGASPIQVVFHHVLPASLPGIITGAILAIARALGETAPLLMIGMVAFIADVPSAITDPATALPVQIYLWADSPESGFQEKTAAAIMVLLAFLLVANWSASIIRKKSEISW